MATQFAQEQAMSDLRDEGRFLEAIRMSNPFERNRVSDPSHTECDVTSIHSEAFERLKGAAVTSLQNHTGIGVLLWGSSGVGKSHLMGRLSRWAMEQKACFVFLHNIKVHPDDMDRYLLKCCVSRLAEDRHDRLHETPLYQVVDAAIRIAAKAEGITSLNTNNEEVFRRLSRRLDGDEEVFRLIYQFYFNAAKAQGSADLEKRKDYAARAALAVRWLKGDTLDSEEAQRLQQHKPGKDSETRLRDDQVELVLLTMARLAQESGRPFLICIDQVDNMKHSQATALGQTLHALIDHAQNLFFVVSGVKEEIVKLIESGVISEAAADRMNHRRPIELRRISRTDARQLVRERIQHFFHQFDALPDRCKPFFQNDDLFPLGQKWFDAMEPDAIEFRPRDVLTFASDRWREIQQHIERVGVTWFDNWQGATGVTERIEVISPAQIEEAIQKKVAEKIEEAVAARRLHRGQLPADAGNLLGITEQLLRRCLGRSEYTIRDVKLGGRARVDLMVEEVACGQTSKNHVQFIVTGSKQSATLQLQKLLNSRDATHRVLVTDEERYPLSYGPKGKEWHQQLLALDEGFTHVKLTFEQYARLDAIESVLGDAKSGDLEIEPLPGHILPVTEEQALESLHRLDVFRQHPLLCIFLAEAEKKEAEPDDPIQEPHFRAFVQYRLSLWMGANLSELVKCYIAAHVDKMAKSGLAACLPQAKTIAMRMHEEELVFAQPWNDDLYLTIGTRA